MHYADLLSLNGDNGVAHLPGPGRHHHGNRLATGLSQVCPQILCMWVVCMGMTSMEAMPTSKLTCEGILVGEFF